MTPKGQSSLQKEKHGRGYPVPGFQTILRSYSSKQYGSGTKIDTQINRTEKTGQK